MDRWWTQLSWGQVLGAGGKIQASFLRARVILNFKVNGYYFVGVWGGIFEVLQRWEMNRSLVYRVPLGVNISGTKLDLRLLKNFIQRRPAAGVSESKDTVGNYHGNHGPGTLKGLCRELINSVPNVSNTLSSKNKSGIIQFIPNTGYQSRLTMPAALGALGKY